MRVGDPRRQRVPEHWRGGWRRGRGLLHLVFMRGEGRGARGERRVRAGGRLLPGVRGHLAAGPTSMGSAKNLLVVPEAGESKGSTLTTTGRFLTA